MCIFLSVKKTNKNDDMNELKLTGLTDPAYSNRRKEIMKTGQEAEGRGAGICKRSVVFGLRQKYRLLVFSVSSLLVCFFLCPLILNVFGKWL